MAKIVTRATKTDDHGPVPMGSGEPPSYPSTVVGTWLEEGKELMWPCQVHCHFVCHRPLESIEIGVATPVPPGLEGWFADAHPGWDALAAKDPVAMAWPDPDAYSYDGTDEGKDPYDDGEFDHMRAYDMFKEDWHNLPRNATAEVEANKTRRPLTNEAKYG